MWVVMSGDQKCIVKGKSRKHLVGVEEPTRKELVSYASEKAARAALMRMLVFRSDYARELYSDDGPVDLVPVETDG